ncbi:hypothetical protein PSP6_270208 [Paraburkholderia tropica]|nr:hypothetical protein PSP6_270208 [Paraburkholderia tropica]
MLNRTAVETASEDPAPRLMRLSKIRSNIFIFKPNHVTSINMGVLIVTLKMTGLNTLFIWLLIVIPVS